MLVDSWEGAGIPAYMPVSAPREPQASLSKRGISVQRQRHGRNTVACATLTEKVKGVAPGIGPVHTRDALIDLAQRLSVLSYPFSPVEHLSPKGFSTCRPTFKRPRAGDSMVVRNTGSAPTALDNGRRTPKELLRAVVARLLGRKSLVGNVCGRAAGGYSST